jgi:glutamate 5-kinase
MTRLGLAQRPEELSQLQAAAAVGQMGLVRAWESAFKRYATHTAQVLLVHDDLLNRKRYLNIRQTLKALMGLSVVPIVNENDTVATDEIRFGDNDTLAAVVANVIDADVLVILTDQDAMFTKDPRHHADAEPIWQASANQSSLMAMAGDGGALGRGGMTTKIQAAQLAARSGTNTVIVGGRIENVLGRLFHAEAELGTLLLSEQKPLDARKLWLSGLTVRGEIELDNGAVMKLRESGVSILPVGVVSSRGHFSKGEAVLCVDSLGNPIAKGLIDYPSNDVQKLLGVSSEDILHHLGYRGSDELMHRDNLVLL